MEKGRLGIAFLVLSLVSVGFTSQNAFAGGVLPLSVSIDDVSIEEGDAGTTNFVFTVTATDFFDDSFTVDYSTAADTATEDDDYVGQSGSVTLSQTGAGSAFGTITIEVNGDTDFEGDETFFVNLSNCEIFCTLVDAQGIGTILNDDVMQFPDPTLYGIGFSGQNGLSQLYTIDVNIGDATPVGDGIGFERCSAMDFDPLTGTLYALCERANGSDLSVLISINTLTGVGTEVGRTFAEDIEFSNGDTGFEAMTDMSFRNSDNVLYAHAGLADEIVTIDVSTGQATDLSAESVGCSGNALAFSPLDTLYLAACDELITIDQTTGDFIESVFSENDVNRVNAMDYDPVSGVLFGIHNEGDGGSDNSLVTIDVSDFSIMTQVPTENGMDAIAVDPLLCEPGFVFDLETEECVEQPVLEPDTMYVGMGSFGNDEPENGSLATADLDTGILTQLGDAVAPQVEMDGLSGLAFDSTDRLFVTAVVQEGSPSRLLELDRNTGAIINDVGFTMTEVIEGAPRDVKSRDLAFQPETDVLFGVGRYDFNNNILFTIDTSTAIVDIIGTIEGSTVQGLAFAPDGTLYGTGGCNLFTLEALDGFVETSLVAELFNCFDGLGIDSFGNIYGTTSGDSVHLIDPEDGSDVTVAGEGTNPSDVDFGPAPLEPTETIASGAGGEGYEGPTLGEFDDGRLIVSDGFCFDQFCLDVLDYFNHLPIQQVNSGTTHTISMTAYCSAGSNRCNYASVGAAPPGTDINSVDWNVMLKRTGNSNDWQVTKVDPNGMLGDVTGTVQVVDASRIQYTFNIEFITPASIGTVDGNAEPPEDNMILVTEIRDSNGGSGRNIFNEGVFVNDIYAYPQVDASYLPSVTVTPLCLNEDPTDRNTCAFELVRQWAIKQAEEKLKEIYEQNNYKTD